MSDLPLGEGDIRLTHASGEIVTVHLPTLLPADGSSYTIRTSKPIIVNPGFQEVQMVITKVVKKE